MSRRAPPPDLFVAADGQVGELQRSVFLRIPLSLKGRNLYRQRVLRRFFASGTVRTATARRTGVDLRLPTVTLGALPPYLLMTSEGNVSSRKRRVANLVPLRQQSPIALLYAKVVERCSHPCSPLASDPPARPFGAQTGNLPYSRTVVNNVEVFDHPDIAENSYVIYKVIIHHLLIIFKIYMSKNLYFF